MIKSLERQTCVTDWRSIAMFVTVYLRVRSFAYEWIIKNGIPTIQSPERAAEYLTPLRLGLALKLISPLGFALLRFA